MAAATVVSTTTPQTGSAPTMAVDMPASVDADDLILVWLSLSGIMSTMPGTPNAFTLKLTGDSNQVWAYLRGAEHIANGSPATYTFTTSGGTITRGMASRINGALASGDPFNATPAVGTTTSSASSAALAVTTTLDDVLLVNYDTKSSSSTNTGTPTGLTLQTPAVSVAHLFAGPQAVAGPSGTKTSTYSTLTNHRSSLVGIAPALPEEGTFAGSYDFSGAFTGEAGPGEGQFAGDYDFSGAFTGQAPPPVPVSGNPWTPGGRDRFTARRTPKNRRRAR